MMRPTAGEAFDYWCIARVVTGFFSVRSQVLDVHVGVVNEEEATLEVGGWIAASGTVGEIRD